MDGLFSIFVSGESYRNELLIKIESQSLSLIDDIFEIIFTDLKKCEIYNFDPVSEEKLALKKKREEKAQKVRDDINKCISILKNLNALQFRMKLSLRDEKELQSFLYPILKSHFQDLEDEFHLPRFGAIEYKPDFGVPSLALLLETKYIREVKDVKKVQNELITDSVAYLKAAVSYKKLIVFIYNNNNVPTPDRFEADLERIPGIVKVITIVGVKPEGIQN